MKREWLKGLGLEDDVVDKIMTENGNDIEKHKTASETAKTENDNLKTQLAERDKQFKELEKSAGDNEELKTKFTKLQADNKKAAEDFAKQLSETKLNNAIDMSLLKANAIDADLVKVKLDNTKIKLKEDGTIEGLDDQLKGIQKDFGFLFKDSTPGTPGITGAPSPDGNPPTTKKIEDMNFEEFSAYAKSHPEVLNDSQ